MCVSVNSNCLAYMLYLNFDLSERPDVATPPLSEGGVDVERGGYLGRFVSDKKGIDPLTVYSLTTVVITC